MFHVKHRQSVDILNETTGICIYILLSVEKAYLIIAELTSKCTFIYIIHNVKEYLPDFLLYELV